MSRKQLKPAMKSSHLHRSAGDQRGGGQVKPRQQVSHEATQVGFAFLPVASCWRPAVAKSAAVGRSAQHPSTTTLEDVQWTLVELMAKAQGRSAAARRGPGLEGQAHVGIGGQPA